MNGQIHLHLSDMDQNSCTVALISLKTVYFSQMWPINEAIFQLNIRDFPFQTTIMMCFKIKNLFKHVQIIEITEEKCSQPN